MAIVFILANVVARMGRTILSQELARENQHTAGGFPHREVAEVGQTLALSEKAKLQAVSDTDASFDGLFRRSGGCRRMLHGIQWTERLIERFS